jgi:hypothetical protein
MNSFRDFAKIEGLSSEWFELLWRTGDQATKKELARRSDIPNEYFKEILLDEELLHAWSVRGERSSEEVNLAIKASNNSTILYNLAEQFNLDTLGLKLLTKKADNPVAQSLLKRRDIPDRARHNLIAKFVHSVGEKFNFSVNYYDNETARRLTTLFGSKPEYFITALENSTWWHSAIFVEASTIFYKDESIVKVLLKKFKEEEIPRELWDNSDFERDIIVVISNLVSKANIKLEDFYVLQKNTKYINGESKILIERNIKYLKNYMNFQEDRCSSENLGHITSLEALLNSSAKHSINSYLQKSLVGEIASHCKELDFDSIYYWYKKNSDEIGSLLLTSLLEIGGEEVVISLLKATNLPMVDRGLREKLLRLLVKYNEHKVLRARLKNDEIVEFLLELQPLSFYLDNEVVVREVHNYLKYLSIYEAEIALSLITQWQGSLSELLLTIKRI